MLHPIRQKPSFSSRWCCLVGIIDEVTEGMMIDSKEIRKTRRQGECFDVTHTSILYNLVSDGNNIINNNLINNDDDDNDDDEC